jgi:hypothetical protein
VIFWRYAKHPVLHECETLLDMVAASGQPKLWGLTTAEARQKVIELTRIVKCEEAVGTSEDRTYCQAQEGHFRVAFARR